MICGIGKGMDRSLARMKQWGLDLVVVIDRATAEVRRSASEVIEADTSDLAAVAEGLKDAGIERIDGVLSLGIDNPPVIAALCRTFGCSGLDPAVARNCTEKDRRIAILRSRGLRVPRHYVCDDLASAMTAAAAIGLPVVVKPNDRTESIGVVKIETVAGAAPLIGQALRASRTGRIVVEEFLTGTEHTVIGLSADGTIAITGVSDRDYAHKELFAPHFFERGDIIPSALSPLSAARVRDTVVRGVRALDLAPALFTADVLVTPAGDVVLLELAGRMAGARIATELIPLATGVDVLPNAVRLALGRPIDRRELEPSRESAVVQRYVPSCGQMVEWVGEIGDLARAPGVYDLCWGTTIEAGRRLPEYRSGFDLLAGVIATAETTAEAERIADHALASLPLRLSHADRRFGREPA
jgi:biotin carboxylase